MSEYKNAFEATAETPAEAVTKSLRADLMYELRWHIDEHGWTQAEAAEIYGVSQPRISDLTRGKMSKFGLEGLITMIVNAGLNIKFDIDGDPRSVRA
jgi:predicted XRE-type DNA-binding protein